MREAEDGVSEALSGSLGFGLLSDHIEGFLGLEFGFGQFEPWFRKGCLGAAALIDGGGGWGLIDHARAEFNVRGYVPSSAFAGDGGSQGERACRVDGFFLGVAGFAAAIEDIGESPA